jgi:DNA mismatch repair ATPase MutS
LSDEYFVTIDEHLEQLKFNNGSLMSARLGRGNRGVDYVLRAPFIGKRTFKEWMGFDPPNTYSFQVAPRDEAGGKYVTELADRGLNLAANALAQSTDHITSFFKLLCSEIGFYVACLNLADRLNQQNEPIVMPVAVTGEKVALSYQGIYDVCLALRSTTPLVGNEADADGKTLIMITGANSGGKSTLLRSLGLAQLMMQAGMFVGAEAYSANVCGHFFTHFIREEDETMESGKLDEELARMSTVADHVRQGDLVMFNESFAATNEREGSEVARQVVTALLEAGIKVMFVTHQFTLADTFYGQHLDTALFLRAERESSGERNYRLLAEPPLPTRFGVDLFNRLGGWDIRDRSLAEPVRVAESSNSNDGVVADP